jgi:hypothetical protein
VEYLCFYGTSSCCRRFVSFLLFCNFSNSHRPLPTGRELSCIRLGEGFWEAERLLLMTGSLGLLQSSKLSCHVAKGNCEVI